MSLIAEHLKKVGIDAKVLSFEWGTYYRDVKSGNFQLASSSWVGLTEPDMYYSVFHSTQVPPDGANRGYYSNTRIDILTEEARREYSQSIRKKLYGEIQEIVQQDLPYISLWHEKNVIVFDKKVKNISISPNASYYGLVGVYKD
jgi:peptide/nickel transport system substrate-binding protein